MTNNRSFVFLIPSINGVTLSIEIAKSQFAWRELGLGFKTVQNALLDDDRHCLHDSAAVGQLGRDTEGPRALHSKNEVV